MASLNLLPASNKPDGSIVLTGSVFAKDFSHSMRKLILKFYCMFQLLQNQVTDTINDGVMLLLKLLPLAEEKEILQHWCKERNFYNVSFVYLGL